MEKKKSESEIFLEVSAACDRAANFRKWEKEKEKLDQAFQNCKASLAAVWEEINLFTDKYGTPPGRYR